MHPVQKTMRLIQLKWPMEIDSNRYYSPRRMSPSMGSKKDKYSNTKE